MAAGHEVGAWRGLILLLAVTAGSGCEANRITGPTPPVPTNVGFADVPADLITTRIEGRVVDEDEAALPDATVTIARVLSDGRYLSVEQSAARATADDRGGFGFNANLPRKWSEIVLTVLTGRIRPHRHLCRSVAGDSRRAESLPDADHSSRRIDRHPPVSWLLRLRHGVIPLPPRHRQCDIR